MAVVAAAAVDVTRVARTLGGAEAMAPGACFTCAGGGVVKRPPRSQFVWPIDTSVLRTTGPMAIEDCPTCGGSGDEPNYCAARRAADAKLFGEDLPPAATACSAVARRCLSCDELTPV